MRTPEDIETFIDSLELPKHLKDDEDNEEGWSNRVHHLCGELAYEPLWYKRKFAQFGLVFGYGDCFAYDSQGVVVIGEGMVGKSTLVSELEGISGGKIYPLEHDCLLLYKSSNNSSLEVHDYPIVNDSEFTNWADLIRQTIDCLETKPGYPLSTIIYMSRNKRRRGFLKKTSEWRPRVMENDYLYGIYADQTFLENVHFLNYNNPCTSFKDFDQRSKEKMVHQVFTRLER